MSTKLDRDIPFTIEEFREFKKELFETGTKPSVKVAKLFATIEDLYDCGGIERNETCEDCITCLKFRLDCMQ